jgi:nitrite reductase/ring-hydroxylating ferredoxin subunit
MTLICTSSDISNNQSKGFNVNGKLFFIVRKEGKLHAYENHCPHLGIQLEMVPDQFLESTHSLIQCSMHGALFQIEDGLCISGPCFDQKLTPVDIQEENGEVFLLD